MVTYRDNRTGLEHRRDQPSFVLDRSTRFEQVKDSRRDKAATTTKDDTTKEES